MADAALTDWLLDSDPALRWVLGEMPAATGTWHRVATSNGISGRELDVFEDWFDGLRDPVR